MNLGITIHEYTHTIVGSHHCAASAQEWMEWGYCAPNRT